MQYKSAGVVPALAITAEVGLVHENMIRLFAQRGSEPPRCNADSQMECPFPRTRKLALARPRILPHRHLSK